MFCPFQPSSKQRIPRQIGHPLVRCLSDASCYMHDALAQAIGLLDEIEPLPFLDNISMALLERLHNLFRFSLLKI